MVRREGGAKVRVRLWGVDCPETRNPRAKEATRFTRNLVFERRVRIETRSTDPYGRTVGLVWIAPGVTLNRELIWFGWAKWSRKYSSKEEEFRKAEEAARAGNRGVW